MNRKTLGVTALLVAGFILAGSVSAFHVMGMGKAPVTTEERVALTTALENGDYTTFTQLRNDYLLKGFALSEEEFNQMKEQHTQQQAIQDAIATGNYSEWVSLMKESNSPWSTELLSAINADNFALLKELNTAKEAGDFERVHEITDELGIGHGFGMGKIRGNEFHHGMMGNDSIIGGNTRGMHGFSNPITLP